jgi:acetyltransferase-like isoleucine patch superfamily enzyme
MNILVELYRFKKLRGIILRIISHFEKEKAFSSTLRKIYKKYYKIEIGYGTYGGCFDIANIPANVSFGNYCSIASGVRIFRANHPANEFTTHPLLYNPIFGYVKTDQLVRPSLIIGNDVWLGANSIILPNVSTIGNGAIVGAGAVVTKDVPPYAIVVGNPAKIIKYRFSPQVIDKIKQLNWWDLSQMDLIREMPNIRKIINKS